MKILEELGISYQWRVASAHRTPELVEEIIQDWKVNSEKLNNMILKDAEKEFDNNSRIGFGLDGDETVRDADFESVRGKYDANSFVTGLQQEIKENSAKAEQLLKKINQ